MQSRSFCKAPIVKGDIFSKGQSLQNDIERDHEGIQSEFPFPNSRDPSGTPTYSKKKTKLLFRLNLFKSESVERTHLYSYVFH